MSGLANHLGRRGSTRPRNFVSKPAPKFRGLIMAVVMLNNSATVSRLIACSLVLPGAYLAPSCGGRAPAKSPQPPAAKVAFPLHTSGQFIVDANGQRVRLKAFNWYGAESPDAVVGGL